jgi:hypothetical protein
MNTLARSLDALIGPVEKKRGRKRAIASVEGDDADLKKSSRTSNKRPRMIEANSATASFASIKSSIRLAAGQTRQINQLAAQQQPLEMVDFSRLEGCTLPASVELLITKLRRCAKGIDTIPEFFKTQILEMDPDLYPDDDVWQPESLLLAERNSSQSGSEADPVEIPVLAETLTTHLSRDDKLPCQVHNHTLSFPQAEMIVEQARECNDNGDLEAGWDSLVHGPLLLLACHLSRHRANVKTINLTHARSLVRLEPQHHAVLTDKIVDFGIYLQNSEKLKSAYREIQPEADAQSRYFNHTDFEQIARKPLAISIATQPEGLIGSQADLQLGVWAKSHLFRLAELRMRMLSSSDRTIWLPLLKIVGPVWYLLMARGDYHKSGGLSSTTVYSRHQLGDVSTYHGFFQVLSAILELINWAEVCYRPWFEEWVSKDQETDLYSSKSSSQVHVLDQQLE